MERNAKLLRRRSSGAAALTKTSLPTKGMEFLRRPQCREFLGREGARAGEEAALAAVVEGEHAAAARHHIEDQLRVAPGVELGRADVDRRAADFAQLHVAVADQEVALRVAHGRGTVAAAARLVKEDRAVPPVSSAMNASAAGVAPTRGGARAVVSVIAAFSS